MNFLTTDSFPGSSLACLSEGTKNLRRHNWQLAQRYYKSWTRGIFSRKIFLLPGIYTNCIPKSRNFLSLNLLWNLQCSTQDVVLLWTDSACTVQEESLQQTDSLFCQTDWRHASVLVRGVGVWCKRKCDMRMCWWEVLEFGANGKSKVAWTLNAPSWQRTQCIIIIIIIINCNRAVTRWQQSLHQYRQNK
jgi:hypothetical protein